MDSKLKSKLIAWAEQYEQPSFCDNDPVKFPRSYMPNRPMEYWTTKEHKNIEIMAIIASWLAYGNRKRIMLACEAAKAILGNSPVDKLKELADRYANCEDNLYRFYKYSDFAALCERLHEIYDESKATIGKIMIDRCLLFPHYVTPETVLIQLFNGIKGFPVNSNSACKRIHLLLRWMVRINSPVDIGIWGFIPYDNLIIPLDTHVHRIALELGLTKRKQADMKTAIEITNAMREIFPNDPARGDFALFGYGISTK